jgi:hypothetical protein
METVSNTPESCKPEALQHENFLWSEQGIFGECAAISGRGSAAWRNLAEVTIL